MAGETIITVVGNLTADPELRYTQNGLPVANFTIASTPRSFDRQANEWKDGEALFMRASVWREFAEHVAGSLTKGMRVVATGRLKQRSYQDREATTAPRSSWRSTRSAPRSGTRLPRSPAPRPAVAMVAAAVAAASAAVSSSRVRRCRQTSPGRRPGLRRPTPGARPGRATATTPRSDSNSGCRGLRHPHLLRKTHGWKGNRRSP